MFGNVQLIPARPYSRSRLLVLALLTLGSLMGGALPPLAAQSPNSPPRPAPATNATTRPLLKSGSQGEAVTELQAMLKLLGYYGGAVSGTYDEATAAAVSQFQKSANLTADGVVGTDTWNRLLPPAPAVTATAPTPTPAKPSTADSFPLPAGTPSTGAKPAPKPTPGTKPTAPTSTTQAAASEVATLPILRIGMKGSAVEGLQERLRSLGYLKGSADGVFGAETQAAVKAAQRKLSLEPDGIVGTATWMGLLR